MCGNGNCSWILIIILLLVCCCGWGTNTGNNGGCGCGGCGGCDNNGCCCSHHPGIFPGLRLPPGVHIEVKFALWASEK